MCIFSSKLKYNKHFTSLLMLTIGEAGVSMRFFRCAKQSKPEASRKRPQQAISIMFSVVSLKLFFAELQN